MDLQLRIQGYRTLEESLRAFVAGMTRTVQHLFHISAYLAEEVLDAENAWRCESCNKRVCARKATQVSP
jgi:ubiquitin C-terminal hydrolase